jgi:hypothetical protein
MIYSTYNSLIFNACPKTNKITKYRTKTLFIGYSFIKHLAAKMNPEWHPYSLIKKQIFFIKNQIN